MPRLARVEPLVDLLAIGILIYTSGGPYSEARLSAGSAPPPTSAAGSSPRC